MHLTKVQKYISIRTPQQDIVIIFLQETLMTKPLFQDFESAIGTIIENQKEIKRELARINKKLRKKPGPKPGNAAKIRKSATLTSSRPLKKSSNKPKSTKGKSSKTTSLGTTSRAKKKR